MELPDPTLVTNKLQAGYGRKHVVYDLDLRVAPGEIVSIIGHNGAGKTTALKTIFGMLPNMGGSVTFAGDDVSHTSPRDNVMRGMSFVLAERFVFADLSVRDNLLLGAFHENDAARREARRQRVFKLFPILEERATQRAGTMSGGQQRMLSLGIALMTEAKLLMLDEPSLGLAPAAVIDIFGAIRTVADEEKLAVILVEQNVGQALRIADRFCVMRSGRIIMEESAAQMRARDNYWELF